MISIVDYKLGNLRSISGALTHLKVPHSVTNSHSVLNQSKGLLLPGVGAFSQGMKNLKELNLDSFLRELILDKKVPVLGICLGFQLLCKTSTEFDFCKGLEIIDADVVKLNPDDSSLRLPHIGWNEVSFRNHCSITKNIRHNLFYFVHSFHVLPQESTHVYGTCEYGGPIVSMIKQDHILGVQFHPEKSQKDGLTLLQNWSNEVLNG